MRRLTLFAVVLLLFAAGVTVSAKTMQERRAERLAERLAKHPAAPSSVSSSSASTVPVIVQPRPVPILVYHHIRDTFPYSKSTWSWKMSVSSSVFERQMQWLEDHGYETVNLDTALAILKGEAAGPAKPVVLTFDDGNLSAYEQALPVLLQHRFTATYYLIVKRFGAKGFISEEQAKDLEAKGMDVESHTVTHSTLTNLGDAALAYELAESKKILEELVNAPVRHVAYPSTAHNQRVRDAASAAGYATGTIMDPRIAVPGDDPMKLPRIMMTDETRMEKILP